jgi:hypothetical protein
VIGCAVRVVRIVTDEIEEKLKEPSGKSRNGYAGAIPRMTSLTGEERKAIARKAAAARWKAMAR